MSLEAAVDALDALARELPAAAGEVRWVEGLHGALTGPELVLHNPSARGALTVGMMAALGRAVRAAEAHDAPVLILRGEAPSFCSGGHLGQVRAGLAHGDRGRRMADAMTVVLDGLAGLSRVVVGVVDGPALGGGAEILTACDHVLCGPGARVGFVQGRLGVAPGWGGAGRLVRRVGPVRALRLLTAAEVLSGEQAVSAGLADVVHGDLPALLARFLAPVAAVAPASIRAMKRQILAAAPLTRTGEEAARFTEVWGSAEHLARLNP